MSAHHLCHHSSPLSLQLTSGLEITCSTNPLCDTIDSRSNLKDNHSFFRICYAASYFLLISFLTTLFQFLPGENSQLSVSSMFGIFIDLYRRTANVTRDSEIEYEYTNLYYFHYLAQAQRQKFTMTQIKQFFL